MEDLFKYHVRIRGAEQGTGLLYFPKEQEYVAILTAKHVLKSDSALGLSLIHI